MSITHIKQNKERLTIILLALVVLILSLIISCEHKGGPLEASIIAPGSGEAVRWRTERYQGCEYVIFQDHSIAHKGNCDNPIHKKEGR